MSIYKARNDRRYYKTGLNTYAVFSDVQVDDYSYKNFDEWKQEYLEIEKNSKLLNMIYCKMAKFRNYSAIHGYKNFIRIGIKYEYKEAFKIK